MIKYLWKQNKLLFAAVTMLTMGVSAVLVYLPKAVGDIVDVLIIGHNVNISSLIIRFVLILIGSEIVLYFCYLLTVYHRMKCRKVLETDLANKLVARLREQSNVINIYSQETELISEDYLSKFTVLIQSISSFIFAVILGASISRDIIIYYTLFTVLLLIITELLVKKIAALTKAVQDNNMAMNRLVIGVFAAIRTINIFFAKVNVLAKLERAIEKRRKAYIKRAVLNNNIGQFNNFLSWLIQYGLMLGAYILVYWEKINIGQATTLILLNSYLSKPMFDIVIQRNLIASTREIRKKLEAILDEPDEEVTADLAVSDIGFCNVSFNYTDETFMSDLNLMFEHGKRYMIVGQSGSGKSTLLKLMLKELSPTSGAITYGGIDIANFNMPTWYKNIAYTSQRVEIIPGTLRENIIMGEVYDATRFNRIISLLNLEYLTDKLDNQLNEDLSNFSGGELQRIAIARMLYNDSPIFIFDEFSSALDNINAYQVERELLKVENKLLISVSHRLHIDLLENYDKIIIMESGRVKRIGKLSELMEDLRPFLLGDDVSSDFACSKAG